MKTKMLVGLGLSSIALAIGAKDAVIMTVNGVDVPKSEFEYLYHKNSQQQMSPQSIDEYATLFKLYKLKVDEARAAGIDTTAAFRKEISEYRHDLAAPYLADSTYIFHLLDEAVDRAKEEVETSHIMLFKTRDAAENSRLRARADSLLKELKGGADFTDLAKRFSGDRGSNSRGGNLGYITSMRFPYAFETAAYNLSDGEISDVVESPVGYHILKGGKRRPSSGKVSASHILIMTQGDPAKEPAALHLADSLYNLAKSDPASFEDLARRYSDDKGSARQGGRLNWFGRGEMVQEFDSVAFALKNGEISTPVKTRFGYHIIYRHDHKDAPNKAELKPSFMSLLASGQDPRTKMVKDHQTLQLQKKYKGKLNKAVIAQMANDAAANGLDSAFNAKWGNSSLEFCSIGKAKYPVKDFVKYFSGRPLPAGYSLAEIINSYGDSYYNNLLVEWAEEDLLKTRPEYANLYREYVDGSLLYEISLRKVWDKAAKDEEGLTRYFNANRGSYVWKEPRAKGYLVQTVNDSVASLIKKRASELGRDSLVNTIRKEFPKEVSIMKVLETKGSNPMVDNLLFGGPEAKPVNTKYTVFFMIDPKVISLPEELSDVRGAVTSDYQNLLQKEWEQELLTKYPVTVNEKVLKQVKPLKK